MPKKKWNELDSGTPTLARLVAHADPVTGKQLKATWSQIVALFTAQTPVKSYADETALLANTDLVIGYLAYQADDGLLYLYNGPTASDINNYTLLSSGLVSQTIPAPVTLQLDLVPSNFLAILSDLTASTGVSFEVLQDTDDGLIIINAIDPVGGNFSFEIDPGGVNGTAGAIFKDQRTVKKGIEYEADYSADFTNRSLVDKQYVDGLALGIVTSWKAPVKVSTTAAGTLASDFENGDTVDGVALVTGDRILIKNQAAATENGIYTVNASGAPTRASDANVAAELEGAAVTVQEGTANANTTWIQTTDAINLGVSNIVFAQLGTSVPDADATTKGIAKLYTTTGSNTDGSMDQNSITNALALKLAITDRVLGLSFSDEVTPITASAGKITYHFPYTTTIQEIWIELKTAQASGSIFTVDVNVNGSTILSTKLTIDNTEETSLTAVAAAVISSASITKADKITVDVDQVGNGTAIGGKIWFRG